MFNVRLELRNGLLSTVWDSSLRMVRRHASAILIFHGGDGSPAFTFTKERDRKCTVSSKIIQALEIIWVKKLIPNAVLWKKNICQVMIFRLYTVYNKHKMIKIGSQNRENRNYYRKCSINFAADCSKFHSNRYDGFT